MADESVSAGVETAEPGAPGPAAPLAGDWRAALPPDLLADKSLERYKDVGSLAKAYVEIERRIGAPLEPPGADAKPEQLSAYRRRLGVPESPDKYELELPPPAEGSGFQWDPNAVTRLKQRAHAAHMTPAQTRAMLEVYHEHMHGLHDQMRASQAREEQAERAEAVAKLAQQWGPEGGPQWRHHHARALTALETLMADAPREDLEEVKALANHPAVAQALSRMADGLIERGFVDGQELPGGLTPSDARARIDEMREASLKDPQHPLKNRAHPDHTRVFNQYMEWQRIEAGDGSQYRRYPSR